MSTTKAPYRTQRPPSEAEGRAKTAEEALLEAADRMELTEQGWIEKVTHPGHGRLVARLIIKLAQLGVPEDVIFDNTRQTEGPPNLRYAPDVFVVLPGNPVPIEDHADYAGAPDLAVEVLSGDVHSPDATTRSHARAARLRDTDEKRRRYAERGTPHYWIADPDTGAVTWLRLEGGAYVEAWTRPLAEVALPWPVEAPERRTTP
jgi:Uma2 family endonuclease